MGRLAHDPSDPPLDFHGMQFVGVQAFRSQYPVQYLDEYPVQYLDEFGRLGIARLGIIYPAPMLPQANCGADAAAALNASLGQVVLSPSTAWIPSVRRLMQQRGPQGSPPASSALPCPGPDG